MKKLFLFLVGYLLLAPSIFAQLQVRSATEVPFTPESLVQNFMTSGGINVLEVAYTGDPVAIGFFTAGTGSIGLERGVVMTTGSAASGVAAAIGADGDGSDFANYTNGGLSEELHLEAIATGQLNDVAVYRITFQAYGDSIRFRYVFGSEEYPEFACSFYNDIFGFFIEGPGYASATNIALIPGTDTPVSINNVHPNNPNYFPCPPAFENYYVNNNNSSQTPAYDGYLVPFEAKAAIQPCETYTLYIAIADVGDSAYDSGVFLEANSFSSANIVTANLDTLPPILLEQGAAQAISIQVSQAAASSFPITLTLGGNAQYGVDYTATDSVFTVTSDTTLVIEIQPLMDSLGEIVEAITLEMIGANCFTKTYELFLLDPNTVFRASDTVTLVAGGLTLSLPVPSALDSVWSFFNSNNFPISGNNPTVSTINTAGIMGYGQLGQLVQIKSVCINVQHPWVEDLDLILESPTGQFIELTSDNGGNGDNYTNTCFTPAATQSITGGGAFAPASMAPFTGNFQPEGPWSDLLGSTPNGDWKLYVYDDVSGLNGTLLDWSIEFETTGSEAYDYTWSNGATDAQTEVDVPGLYTVTVSNQFTEYIQTYLVVAPCGFSTSAYTICPDESIEVNGVVYNAQNLGDTYAVPLSSGCDSLVFVQVNLLPTVTTTLYGQLCEGATYDFNGQTLDTAGVYEVQLGAANGCDSTVVLNLAVLPNYTTAIDTAVAPNQSVTIAGQTFDQPGDFVLELSSSNGCDSTLLVHIEWVSGTQAAALEANVALMPNPAQDQVQVRWPREFGFQQITVTDMCQRTITEQPLEAGQQTLSLQVGQWSPGVYLVWLQGPTGRVAKMLVRL